MSYRLAHARYHHQEYQRIVAAHVDAKLELGSDIWEIGFPGSDEETQSHNRFFIECEAHLYACVQAIHAAADNLAHLLYYGLGLNLKNTFPLRDVSLHSLVAHLNKSRQSDPSLVKIVDLLSQLKDTDAFKGLSDLANQLKHHGGPSASLALAPSPEQPYEVRFGDFLRKDEWRPAKAVEQFLGDAFRVVNVAVVDAGIALNTWLRSATTRPVSA